MAKEDPKKVIDVEVSEYLELEKSLKLVETELLESDTFRKYIALQQRIKSADNELWSKVGPKYIELYEAGVLPKTLKYEWGTISAVRNVKLDINMDELPKKFKKIVADTTMIHGTYDLEGKPPKGVKVTIEHSFRKSLKK
jgi:hypothetical protein